MLVGADDVQVNVQVNGRSYSGVVDSRLLLSDFLRHKLGLTGTHVGCEHGVCGACTVLLNGEAVRSCLVFAAQVDGSCVETVEGLAGAGDLHPLQEAFREHFALQCGFCTGGILMAMLDFLRQLPSPTRAEIADALSGHLCRCTGYLPIINAVEAYAHAVGGVSGSSRGGCSDAIPATESPIRLSAVGGVSGSSRGDCAGGADSAGSSAERVGGSVESAGGG